MTTAVATAPAKPETKALTIVERVEQSPAIVMLDSRSSGLLELLPSAAAVSRFRRIVIQAIAKTPALLECTPESLVLAVFEAAQNGLEPTGAVGGAHLVPFNEKVAKNPDRWEKRVQMIPDYRGVIRLVTAPDPITHAPSEVLAIEAGVVKEGDEFDYARGTEAWIAHKPSLQPDRSARATTHVYSVARLRNGERLIEVMDRADVERIRQKRRNADAFSPWSTDWDEMGKKTVVKRHSKYLPVRPEVRSILARDDDEREDIAVDATPAAAPGQRKVDRLAQRLATAAPAETEAPSPDDAAAAPEQSAGEDVVEGTFEEVPEPAEPDAAADDGQLTPGARLREAIVDTADANAGDKAASPAAVGQLLEGPFKGWDRELVRDGITALFGAESYTKPRAHEVAAIRTVADSMTPVAFLAAWRSMLPDNEAAS